MQAALTMLEIDTTVSQQQEEQPNNDKVSNRVVMQSGM
jgi:hypothetical protein